MSWLKKEAEKAEHILRRGSETAEGPIVVSGYEWDWENGPVAEAIERVARAFAVRVLRSVSCLDSNDPPDVHYKLEENIRLEIEEADKDEP